MFYFESSTIAVPAALNLSPLH